MSKHDIYSKDISTGLRGVRECVSCGKHIDSYSPKARNESCGGNKNQYFARGSGDKMDGGGDSDGGYITETISKLDIQNLSEKEKNSEKIFSENWKFYVDGYEWDLSDVIDIEWPCSRDIHYWIVTYKNNKKIRITGNVRLEEI